MANMQLISSLRVIALFDELGDVDLARISERCTMFTYRRHAQILGEHEQTNDVFFILAGSVRINSISPKGREVIYSESHAGNIFGEFSAIDGLPRSATVFALTDCTLARMPAKAFFELLHSNAPVATKLVELLVAKIRKTSQQVFEVAALSLRERLRRELLRLADGGERVGQSVVIKPAPTHQEIASHVGSHREAVTREFNRFEAEGLLEVHRRHICILDLNRLERMRP
jgi:CRP/FNR family cyclic AMP-dependent transcriptional regulator